MIANRVSDTMKGYFDEAYELSQNPVDGETDYTFLGLMIFLSPILIPLHYIGRVAENRISS